MSDPWVRIFLGRQYSHISAYNETDGCFFSYKVYLHDPSYHYLVNNPLASPRIFRNYKDLTSSAATYEWLYITVTEHHKLNRKTQPCEV